MDISPNLTLNVNAGLVTIKGTIDGNDHTLTFMFFHYPANGLGGAQRYTINEVSEDCISATIIMKCDIEKDVVFTAERSEVIVADNFYGENFKYRIKGLGYIRTFTCELLMLIDNEVIGPRLVERLQTSALDQIHNSVIGTTIKVINKAYMVLP